MIGKTLNSWRLLAFKFRPTLLCKGKILCIPWNSWKGEQVLLVYMLGFLCCTEDSFACLEVFSSGPCFAALQARKIHHVRDGYLKSKAESWDEFRVIVNKMNSEEKEEAGMENIPQEVQINWPSGASDDQSTLPLRKTSLLVYIRNLSIRC